MFTKTLKPVIKCVICDGVELCNDFYVLIDNTIGFIVGNLEYLYSFIIVSESKGQLISSIIRSTSALIPCDAFKLPEGRKCLQLLPAFYRA